MEEEVGVQQVSVNGLPKETWRLWAEAALLLLINKRFEKLFRGPPGTAGFSSLPGCHHIWVGSECSSFLSQILRFPLHLPHFFGEFLFLGGGGKEIPFNANPYAEHTRPNVAITYVHR